MATLGQTSHKVYDNQHWFVVCTSSNHASSYRNLLRWNRELSPRIFFTAGSCSIWIHNLGYQVLMRFHYGSFLRSGILNCSRHNLGCVWIIGLSTLNTWNPSLAVIKIFFRHIVKVDTIFNMISTLNPTLSICLYILTWVPISNI